MCYLTYHNLCDGVEKELDNVIQIFEICKR